MPNSTWFRCSEILIKAYGTSCNRLPQEAGEESAEKTAEEAAQEAADLETKVIDDKGERKIQKKTRTKRLNLMKLVYGDWNVNRWKTLYVMVHQQRPVEK